MTSQTQCTYELFQRDVAEHKLTVKLSDGLYRHLHCGRPETISMSFSVITWPGHLAVTGDMGCYVFSRTPDMFAFFRSYTERDINLSYWAEKLQAEDTGSESWCEFSEDSLRENCLDVLSYRAEDFSEEKRAEILEQLKEEVFSDESRSLEQAHQCLEDFDVDGEAFFQDTWEWNLTEPTFHYTWICYAILWAIARYDELQADVESKKTATLAQETFEKEQE